MGKVSSNSVCELTARSANEKNAKRHVLPNLRLYFLYPHDIYGTGEVKNFKVGKWAVEKVYYSKISKLGQLCVCGLDHVT